MRKPAIVALSFALLLLPATTFAQDEFDLMRDDVVSWAEGRTGEHVLVGLVEYLSDEGMTQADSETLNVRNGVPSWFKTVSLLWNDGVISDSQFYAVAAFLVDAGVIAFDTTASTNGQIVQVAKLQPKHSSHGDSDHGSDGRSSDEGGSGGHDSHESGDKIDSPGIAIDSSRGTIYVTYGNTTNELTDIYS